MHRLPKKLKESILSNTDDVSIGWDVHSVKIPDFHQIFMPVFFVLVISGITSAFWAGLMKDIGCLWDGELFRHCFGGMHGNIVL